MKRTYRNALIGLSLFSSLALPGLALADNGHPYSPKQYHSERHEVHRERDRDHHRGREYAERDDFARHEGREHRRWESREAREHRYHEWREHRHWARREAREYRDHEWREHARRYYRLHRHYGYGVYPSAFVTGTYIVPAPRLVIDLR